MRKKISKLLVFVLLIMNVCFVAPNASTLSISGTVKTSSGNLNVRSGAGTSYKILGSLSNGAKVTITDDSNADWYTIKYNSGKGYVNKDYITFTTSTQYVKISSGTLNVRSGAGTNYSSLGSLKNGQAVTIIDSSNADWYAIKYNNNLGYVSKQYITKTKPSSDNGDTSGYVARSASNNLVNFLKNFEAFHATKYKDQGGKWTIGYGHLIQSGESFGTLTEAQASALLKKDLSSAVTAVNSLCKSSNVRLTQSQFDSLVSFAFNCGNSALKGSTLWKDIAAGVRTASTIEKDFMMWVKVNGQTSRGLQNRRYSEARMFNNGEYKRYSKY